MNAPPGSAARTILARKVAKTPLHAFLRLFHRKLSRYMDLAENWSNGDEGSNGEAFLIGRAGPHLRTVFDVGANLGRWSALALQSNEQCRVFAFEASPRTFRALAAELKSHPRVHLYPFGLGDRAETLPFHDYGDGSGLSSFCSRERSVGWKAEQILSVPVTTFDQFATENRLDHVDFVKIDTEGHEMAVLRGMKAALAAQRVSLVQFEYGGTWLDAGATLADAHRFLEECGYRLYRLLPDSLESVHYDCRIHECFKYANFAAVPSPETLRDWNIPTHEP